MRTLTKQEAKKLSGLIEEQLAEWGPNWTVACSSGTGTIRIQCHSSGWSHDIQMRRPGRDGDWAHDEARRLVRELGEVKLQILMGIDVAFGEYFGSQPMKKPRFYKMTAVETWRVTQLVVVGGNAEPRFTEGVEMERSYIGLGDDKPTIDDAPREMIEQLFPGIFKDGS